MSDARALLHAIAGFGAVVVAFGFAVAAGRSEPVTVALIVALALAAGQLGAFAGWPIIDRGQDSVTMPLLAGVVMTVVAHLSLGILLVMPALFTDARSIEAPLTLAGGALAVTFYSLLFVGWITLPVAAIAAVVVGRRRRRERAAGRPA